MTIQPSLYAVFRFTAYLERQQWVVPYADVRQFVGGLTGKQLVFSLPVGNESLQVAHLAFSAERIIFEDTETRANYRVYTPALRNTSEILLRSFLEHFLEKNRVTRKVAPLERAHAATLRHF